MNLPRRLDALAPVRRRLLLALTALVLAAAVALVAVAVLAPSRGRPARPVPQGLPGPVLLIPGYGGDEGTLADLAARIRATGRRTTIVHLPGHGFGDLRAQAQAVAAAVRAVQGSAPSVDLVGYSDGGVVARLYVRDDGGASRVRRVITLGSPQHGTDLAAAAGTLVPGACTGACAQVLPDSELLRALNSGDETPAGPRWVALWTEQDQTVEPPTSASLAGAVDIDLQAICPDEQVSHGGLPHSRLVVGIVLAAIAVPVPVAPTAADCQRLRQESPVISR